MMLAGVLAAMVHTVTAQPSPPRPLLGVIRWDMYSGHAEITQKQEFGFLKPEEYWWRAPFFVRRTGDPEHPLSFNPDFSLDVLQEAMDQEIRFAASCGIDYWAFGFERSDRNWGIRYNLDAYLKSPLKGEIGFCAIANAPAVGNLKRWEPPSTVYDPAFVLEEWRGYVREFVALMQEPSYQRVLDGRPLIYVYHPEGLAKRLGDGEDFAELAKAIRHLREAAQAAGAGNPYVVCMMEGQKHRELLHAGVADAVTLYHYRYGPVGQDLPYRQLWPSIRNQVLEKRFAGDDVSIVVPLMSGANWVPRFRVMPQTFPNWNWLEPEPGELGAHLAAGLDYVAEHPAKCPADSVLMYAWNEHSEGGFLCPLMGDPPEYEPVTRQIDEVSRTLANWTPPATRETEGVVLANYPFGDRAPTCESLDDDPGSLASALKLPPLAYYGPTTRAADGTRGFCVVHHVLAGKPDQNAFEFSLRPAKAGPALELTGLEFRLWRRAGGGLRRLSVTDDAGKPLGGFEFTERPDAGWERCALRFTPVVSTQAETTVRLVPEAEEMTAVKVDDVRLRGCVR
jgi:hypothetical protein